MIWELLVGFAGMHGIAQVNSTSGADPGFFVRRGCTSKE